MRQFSTVSIGRFLNDIASSHQDFASGNVWGNRIVAILLYDLDATEALIEYPCGKRAWVPSCSLLVNGQQDQSYDVLMEVVVRNSLYAYQKHHYYAYDEFATKVRWAGQVERVRICSIDESTFEVLIEFPCGRRDWLSGHLVKTSEGKNIPFNL